jgi:leucine dehydrogenase
MKHDLESLIQRWDGLAIVSRYDIVSGAWIFICMHDNTLGPCTGGTRMKVYDSPAEGLRDGMRLAEGMTCKWAAINEPVGGGKAVLALSQPLDDPARRRLLLLYGHLIESLNGAFKTGEDMGTTSSDMQVIAEVCSQVHGFHPVDHSKIDPSPFTARAVFEGIKSAVAFAYGTEELAERSVLIQGVGNVGLNLGRMLTDAGASLLISDIDAERTRDAASQLGATVVPAAEIFTSACDVYAPCAIGATLSEATIPSLRCRIVAGSANNQLAEPADAQRLLEREIIYVPDYIINAGGALSFALMDRGHTDLDALQEEMTSIGTTVREILEEAAKQGESPVAAAERRVQETLTGARDT